MDAVKSPDLSGFESEAAAQAYINVRKKALDEFRAKHKIDWNIMVNPPYPVNLGMAVGMDNFPIHEGAYKANNIYLREVYSGLFPSDFVKSFESDPRMSGTIDACRKGLLDQLKQDSREHGYDSNDRGTYSLTEKREREMAMSGVRMNVPRQFSEFALEELNNGDPTCEAFVRYMAMLSLASYERLKEYAPKEKELVPSFESFLNRDEAMGKVSKALLQTVRNYGNFADLLAVIVHAEEKVRQINIPLRQYFATSTGELVAKCGFLDAFKNHIPDLVLAGIE